jgi:hypothetical protein
VKKVFALSTTILLILVISGCSSMYGQPKQQSSYTTTMKQKTVYEEYEDNINENNPDIVTSTVFRAKGNYIGKIDNSSVEINVDGVIRVFVVSEGISDYEEGTTLEFSYYTNEHGQNVISKVLGSSSGN